jgi:hypothetical protein
MSDLTDPSLGRIHILEQPGKGGMHTRESRGLSLIRSEYLTKPIDRFQVNESTTWPHPFPVNIHWTLKMNFSWGCVRQSKYHSKMNIRRIFKR